MLRLIAVSIIILYGSFFSFKDSFYAVVFYVWNAYFRPEEWVWSESIRALNLSFVIGAYACLATLVSRKTLPRQVSTYLLTAFFLHSFVSLVGSPYASDLVEEWIKFAKVMIICYLILMNVQDFAKLRLTLWIIVCSLGLEGAKQGWISLLSLSTAVNTNSLPFLGDNNGVALGMAMLVPIVWLLAQTASRRLLSLFYLGVLVGVVLRALYTFSRGGFMALMTLLVATWVLSHQKWRNLWLVVVFVVLSTYLLPTSYWERIASIQHYDEVEDKSALGRLHFWNTAVKMANDHPFLGMGPNAYRVAFDTYDDIHGAYGERRHVHSTYFGVLAELGYVGASLFAMIVFSALYACYQIRTVLPPLAVYHPLRQTALALALSLMAYLVGAAFLTFQYSEMFWHFIALIYAAHHIFQQYQDGSTSLLESK